MSDINNDDYLLYTLFRKGTSDDPYIEKSEEQQVHNCIVRLSEIPQKQYRVSITSSDNSLWYEIDDGLPESNQYKVNYNTGSIQFSSDNEAKTFTFNYLSVGQILINSERIKISLDQGLNVQDTLQKLIDDNRIDGNLAHRKSPVNTYNDIATTYPLPIKGDMVQTLDTNKMWIWTGQDWYWFYTFPTQQVINLQNNVTDIYNKIGDLSQLPTTDKTSLVNSNRELSAQLAEETQQRTSANDATNAMVAQKANQSYVDTMLSLSSQDGPNGIFPTLAGLQSAYPSGTTGTFLVLDTDPSVAHSYGWNGSAWQDLGSYQGVEVGSETIINNKYADNSVSGDKTDFLTQHINLFNKDSVITTGYYNKNGVFNASETYSSTGFMKLISNLQYITNIGELGGIFGEVCFWDKDKKPISGGMDAGSWLDTLNAPTNARYVTIAYRTGASVDYVMFIQGGTLPSTFSPFGFEIDSNIKVPNESINNESITREKYTDGSVSGDKTDFIDLEINLFDVSKISNGGYFNANGVFQNNILYSSTEKIKIQGGYTYVTNIGYLGGIFGDISFFDKDLNPIPGIVNGNWSGTISTPANARYMTIPFKTANDIRMAMLVEGSSLPSVYVPYQYSTKNILKIAKDSISSKSINYEKTDFIKSETNLFDINSISDGEYYNTSGALQSSSTYSNSGFISVEPGEKYQTNVQSIFGDICFWDSNHQPISGSGISAGSWSGEINIPNNDAITYLTFPYKTGVENLNLLMVVKGDTLPSAYIAYGGKKVSFVDPIDIPTYMKTEGKALLCFGDSVTETATVSDDGTSYVEGTRSNWPKFVKDDLKFGQMWNYAKSGAGYRDNTGSEYRQHIANQITEAISNNKPADIIVVSCGTNDADTSLGDYSTAMSKATLNDLDRTLLYEAIRYAFWKLRTQYPNAKCYAATPLQRESREPLLNLDDAIIRMANRYNFIVINNEFESGITRENAGLFLVDGLHPNVTGQQMMAKLFGRVIINTYNPI
jgi:lysophospholipase L1-like esterase